MRRQHDRQGVEPISARRQAGAGYRCLQRAGRALRPPAGPGGRGCGGGGAACRQVAGPGAGDRRRRWPGQAVSHGGQANGPVVPAHSFKFAAKLQSVNDGPNPTLIRIETNAGHGAGKPTNMVIAEYADRFAFALWNMGITEIK